MRTRITLRRERGDVDLVVTADATASVGDVAAALFTADPDHRGAVAPEGITLHVAGVGAAGRVLDPADPVVDAGVRSGATVTVTRRSGAFQGAAEGQVQAAALLRVLSGPDAGREFPLASGSNVVGRSPEVTARLSDPLVSKRHLRINVSSGLEVIDLGSANGVVVAGRQIQRESVAMGDVISIGNTELAVVQLGAGGDDASGHIAVNRSPRVVPPVVEVELQAPEPPRKVARQRFPWLAVVAPMVMGAGIYLVSPSIQSLMFIALGPVLGVGAWIDQSIQVRRAKKADAARYAASLQELERELQEWQAAERAARLSAFPSLAECCEAVVRAGDVLWTRRPEHEQFDEIRIGLGTVASAVTVAMPGSNDTEPDHWRALVDLVARYRMIEGVPVTAALASTGSLGVAGRPDIRDGVARGLVGQMVALHSPAELALTALSSSRRRETWEWLTWLPHVDSPHSPIEGEHLAADSPAASSLILRLEELVAQRGGRRVGFGNGRVPCLQWSWWSKTTPRPIVLG